MKIIHKCDKCKFQAICKIEEEVSNAFNGYQYGQVLFKCFRFVQAPQTPDSKLSYNLDCVVSLQNCKNDCKHYEYCLCQAMSDSKVRIINELNTKYDGVCNLSFYCPSIEPTVNHPHYGRSGFDPFPFNP